MSGSVHVTVRGEVANLGYTKNFDVADREAIIQGIFVTPCFVCV